MGVVLVGGLLLLRSETEAAGIAAKPDKHGSEDLAQPRSDAGNGGSQREGEGDSEEVAAQPEQDTAELYMRNFRGI